MTRFWNYYCAWINLDVVIKYFTTFYIKSFWVVGSALSAARSLMNSTKMGIPTVKAASFRFIIGWVVAWCVEWRSTLIHVGTWNLKCLLLTPVNASLWFIEISGRKNYFDSRLICVSRFHRFYALVVLCFFVNHFSCAPLQPALVVLSEIPLLALFLFFILFYFSYFFVGPERLT